ncbi:MAG: PAS domain S-box protein, partial [Gemmatimonadota bacterium]
MRPGLYIVPALVLGILLPGGTGVGQSLPTLPVRDVLIDEDGDRVPDRIGETVTVEGIIISTPLVMNPEASLVNFQDSTGGLVLFTRDTTALQGLLRGDSIRARGRLDQYRGAEQLIVEEIRRLGRTRVPEPRDVLVSDLLGEQYFGQLVRVAGTLTARETEAGWGDVELRDRTGVIRVYISSRWLTDPGFVERLARGGAVEVVGIASQDTGADPPAGGYRIVPRDIDDFTFPVAPPYGLFGTAALVMLGLLLFWWYRRERRRARELEQLTRELKESQEALLTREERFRSLVENAADAMSILGPDGRIDYQSPSLRRMLGWRAGDVEGRNALDLVHPEDRGRARESLSWLVARPGESADTELRLQAKDGSWHWVEVIGTNRLQDAAVRGIVCNMRDVTQHRVLEQLVRDADRIEAIGRLAGGVAHDFNNVLTALRGHAELALEALDADAEAHHEVME